MTFWDLCRHNRTAVFRDGSTQRLAFGKRVSWNGGCNHSNAKQGCCIFQKVTCGSVVHGRGLHSKEKTMYAATSHACSNTRFLRNDFFFFFFAVLNKGTLKRHIHYFSSSIIRVSSNLVIKQISKTFISSFFPLLFTANIEKSVPCFWMILHTSIGWQGITSSVRNQWKIQTKLLILNFEVSNIFVMFISL